jgi:hypothetical protein
MVAWLWSGALGLTMVGALFFWGARLFAPESFYLDSSVILGLALILVGLAHL